MVKRAFDFMAAFFGLLFLLPLFLLVAVFIRLDSRGPVFFKQERVGRNFERFFIYKFRTMEMDSQFRGPSLTYGDDPRITRAGKILRRTKIDELPQLINVLKGDMSLVGPRPELPRYVEMFREDYQTVLSVRPGITDLASLEFRNESEVLGRSGHPEEEYINRILPKKIELAKEYIRNSSLRFDLELVLKTVIVVFGSRARG